ncbi:T7SS effector LXG polymorphic toxin [Virgibacillus kimchii]
MGHKVDISEVIEFSDDLKTAAADLKSNLNRVEENIEQLDAIRSFSGKTAKEAKNYFNDLHKTLLKTFEILFTDLDEHVKKHLNSFGSRVDNSDSAIIESDYLMDTEGDVNDSYDRLSAEQESVRETIASVSDISSANHPSTMSLNSDYRSVIKVITDLERSLESYTTAGRSEISETEELLHHIEKAIQNAGAVAGPGRFTDYQGNVSSVGLHALREFNDDRRELVLEKARDAKESAIKYMNEPSQELLNKVYQDLKNGKIDEAEYYEHLAEIRKINNEEEGEVSENFIRYVMDNFGDVADDLRGNAITSIIGQKIKDAGNDRLNRADLVKAMNANNPSSTSNYLREQGNKILNVGRAVSGTLAALTIGAGTYIDFKHNDKTAGEAFTKNATAGGIGFGVGMGTSAAITGIAALFGAATPVGWAIAGGVAVGSLVTWGFNWAYDSNFLGIQDGLDWAGQQLDKAGEQVNKAWNWADEKVNDGLNWVGETVKGGLDFINPWS